MPSSFRGGESACGGTVEGIPCSRSPQLSKGKRFSSGVANLPGGHILRWERAAGADAPARSLPPPSQGTPMNDQPQLSAQDLLDQMRGHFEKLCTDVAAAVNA